MSTADSLHQQIIGPVNDRLESVYRYFRRDSDRVAAGQLLPALFWVGVFLLSSLLIMVVYSFAVGPPGNLTLTLQNYHSIFTDMFYWSIMWDSFVIAVKTTLVCLAITYPAAYYLAFMVEKRKNLFLLLMILPFWINLVVRTYAWRLLLSTTGAINYFLVDVLGVIDQPMNMLFSQGAIVVGMIHIFLPFMLIPIYTSLARIDQDNIEAAKNLGAGRFETFYEVTLPQSLPGVTAAVLLTFVLSFGSFLTPQLLGGQSNIMIANVIASFFGLINDWGLGAALSVVFVVLVLAFVYLVNKVVGLEELYGSEEGSA